MRTDFVPDTGKWCVRWNRKRRVPASLLGGVHYNLFSDGEVQQFTNAVNTSDLFKPIRSACQRAGGSVLWAVYDILLSTRDAPGAVRHASIASKLQECVTQSLGECDHMYDILCVIFNIFGAIYYNALIIFKTLVFTFQDLKAMNEMNLIQVCPHQIGIQANINLFKLFNDSTQQ